MLRGGVLLVIPGRVPELHTAAACQPAWARESVWDARDPANCLFPIAPYSEADPTAHDLCPEFFRERGERFAWPDEDMLHRAMWEGGTSYSACAKDTVLHTHHLGLSQHYAVARASVEADAAEMWIPGECFTYNSCPLVCCRRTWTRNPSGAWARMGERRARSSGASQPTIGSRQQEPTLGTMPSTWWT